MLEGEQVNAGNIINALDRYKARECFGFFCGCGFGMTEKKIADSGTIEVFYCELFRNCIIHSGELWI